MDLVQNEYPDFMEDSWLHPNEVQKPRESIINEHFVFEAENLMEDMQRMGEVEDEDEEENEGEDVQVVNDQYQESNPLGACPKDSTANNPVQATGEVDGAVGLVSWIDTLQSTNRWLCARPS